MLTSWIYEIADLFLSSEKSAALLTGSGEILHAKSDLGFEISGFRPLTENSLKYIALKPGDILIANDPFSGGSFLHRYSFLMPLKAAEGNNPALLLCIRREFAPHLNICNKLDEEGLRIPPTPVFQNGQLVTPIIEAMSLHPMCPEGFSAWLQKTTSDLTALYQKWNRLEKNKTIPFSAGEIKKFLDFSQKYATENILEKASGDARSEVRLDSGETLKLHLEIHDGFIKADFSGTTAGVKTHLPDVTTFGACYEALMNFYDFKCLKNSGSFSVLQVTKPLGCFLNAKYPASTHQGMKSGVAAVKTAMSLALHQIVKNSQALRSEGDACFEMAFANGTRWMSQWSASSCSESISLEKIEAQYPVQFVQLTKQSEGCHLQVEFKVLTSCQMRWLSDFTKHPLKAPKGLKAPAPIQIESQNEKGEWATLNSQGNSDLPAGTHLRLNLWGLYL